MCCLFLKTTNNVLINKIHILSSNYQILNRGFFCFSFKVPNIDRENIQMSYKIEPLEWALFGSSCISKCLSFVQSTLKLFRIDSPMHVEGIMSK